ncbi:hypothetical protein PRIPAC_71969, partial [Pristionchus pacificus]|uniref:Uncharacterized protein n=1 Tax=Pristionchus pacificus TaxID=54126 RepID=A0A2A6C789_PRIPA
PETESLTSSMAAEQTAIPKSVRDPAATKSGTLESTVSTSPHVSQSAPESRATNGSGGMRDDRDRKDISATIDNPVIEQPIHPVDDSKVTRRKKMAVPSSRIGERESETDVRDPAAPKSGTLQSTVSTSPHVSQSAPESRATNGSGGMRDDGERKDNDDQVTKEFEEWERKERAKNDSILHSSNQVEVEEVMDKSQTPLDSIMQEMGSLSTDTSSEVRIERMMNNLYHEINEVDSWLRGLTKLPEEEELTALREARDKVIDQLGRDMLMEFESNDKAWENVEREWIERFEKEKKAKEDLILVMEEIKEITGHKGSVMNMKETTRMLQNKVQFLLHEQERLRQEVQRLANENRDQKRQLSTAQAKGATANKSTAITPSTAAVVSPASKSGISLGERSVESAHIMETMIQSIRTMGQINMPITNYNPKTEKFSEFIPRFNLKYKGMSDAEKVLVLPGHFDEATVRTFKSLPTRMKDGSEWDNMVKEMGRRLDKDRGMEKQTAIERLDNIDPNKRMSQICRDIEEFVNRGMGHIDQDGRDQYMRDKFVLIIRPRVEYGRILEAYNAGCKTFDELKEVAVEQEYIEYQKRMARKVNMTCTSCGGKGHSARDHYKHQGNENWSRRDNGRDNGGQRVNNFAKPNVARNELKGMNAPNSNGTRNQFSGPSNNRYNGNSGSGGNDGRSNSSNRNGNNNDTRNNNPGNGGTAGRAMVNLVSTSVEEKSVNGLTSTENVGNVTFLGRRLQARMLVEGKYRGATVDSGAEVSLIPARILEGIVANNKDEWWKFREARMEPVDLNIRVSNANDGPMKIIGQVVLSVMRNKKDRVNHIGFFVTDDDQDEIILGVNAFNALEIKFTIGDKEKLMDNENEARVGKRLSVEPGQVTDLEVKGPKSEERILWSSNELIESGACTLDENGITTIPILNNTKRTIMFEEDEIIGEWSHDVIMEQKKVHARVEYIAMETGIMVTPGHPAHLDHICAVCPPKDRMSLRNWIVERRKGYSNQNTSLIAETIRVTRAPITPEEAVEALLNACVHTMSAIAQLDPSIVYEGEPHNVPESLIMGDAIRAVIRSAEEELAKDYMITSNPRFIPYTVSHEVQLAPGASSLTQFPLEQQLTLLEGLHPGRFLLLLEREVSSEQWDAIALAMDNLISKGWKGVICQVPLTANTKKEEYETTDERMELLGIEGDLVVCTHNQNLWQEFVPLAMAFGTDKNILPIFMEWNKKAEQERTNKTPYTSSATKYPRGGGVSGGRGIFYHGRNERGIIHGKNSGIRGGGGGGRGTWGGNRGRPITHYRPY